MSSHVSSVCYDLNNGDLASVLKVYNQRQQEVSEKGRLLFSGKLSNAILHQDVR